MMESDLNKSNEPNADHKGWYNRGYLPHYDIADIYQMVTYRLADSLPKERLLQIEAELELTPPDLMDDKRRIMIEEWLDSGHGSCILREKSNAEIVVAAWKFFDGERYELLSWVVMPNHVHVLIKVNAKYSLEKIVKSWKSFTAKEINNILRVTSEIPSGKNRFWQCGYWDRYARNERHLLSMIEYIELNFKNGGVLHGDNYLRK